MLLPRSGWLKVTTTRGLTTIRGASLLSLLPLRSLQGGIVRDAARDALERRSNLALVDDVLEFEEQRLSHRSTPLVLVPFGSEG